METANLKLKKYIENIEALQEQRKDLQAQVGDIFKEAKNNGFDPKAMREVLRKRKLTTDQRVELENLEETYKEAIGMLS